MKHISILLPKEEAALGCIENPHKLYNQVNSLVQVLKQRLVYKVQLVGIDKYPKKYGGVVSVQPDITINDIVKTDLIIIPRINSFQKSSVELIRDFYPWIVKHYRSGAKVASLCEGVLFWLLPVCLKGVYSTQKEHDQNISEPYFVMESYGLATND